MVCFFLDKDSERTDRNLKFFRGKDDILFVPLTEFSQLDKFYYHADAIVIYYTCEMDVDTLSGINLMTGVNVYLICDKDQYTANILNLCSGATVKERVVETDELYDFLNNERKNIEKGPKNQKEIIEKLFMTFFISHHLYGIDYLKHAIEVCCCNADLMYGITKNLYPYLAACYMTNPAAVEHAIRTAIAHLWKENEEKLSRLLFLKRGEKPTNKTFIFAFARYVNEKI